MNMFLTKTFVAAKSLFDNKSGATAIEYGLIAALLAVAIILAVTAVGDQLFATFNSVNTSLGGTAVTRP